MTNLEDLNLAKNKITSKALLRKFVYQCQNDFLELDISKNQIIGIPNSIIESDNCFPDLKNYFEGEDKGKEENKSLKIILIGNGCVGKTSIVKRLIENPKEDIAIPEEERTHGIVIQDWKIEHKDILAQVWDFGGQEVFHPTHRLFLSPRTLYLLVWAVDTIESKQETNYKPEYWLDYISDLGPRSRVILVQNMIDLHGVRRLENEVDLIRYYEHELGALQFGNPQSISAATGQRRGVLLEEIKENLQEILRKHHETIPSSWSFVRTLIQEKIELGEPKMQFSEFTELCSNADLSASACNSLIHFLHDTGVLFYRKNLFNNEIILDQQWAVNAVYEVLRSPRISQRMVVDKFFTIEDAKTVWPEHSDEEIAVFLSFMTSCEIAFETKVDKEKRYIVPQLLPKYPLKRADTWKGNFRVMHCLLHYPYLHRAIIERFIVKTAQLTTDADQDLWQNAIFIYDDQTASEAVITADKEQNRIYLRTWGNEQGLMLAKIKEVFDKIRSFKDRVSLSYSWDGENWIKEEALQKSLKRKEKYVYDHKDDRHPVADYSIFLQEIRDREGEKHLQEGSGLLEGEALRTKELYQRPLFTSPQPKGSSIAPKKIFISYSRQDSEHYNQLLLHLTSLKRRQRIATWSDTDILPSEDWDYRIKEELEKADIILLLVSIYFLASSYIWEVEIRKAIDRHNRKEVKVIPIALNYCDWEGMPFVGLQGPITPHQPIAAYPNQNEAWSKVVQGIKRVIDSV